MINTKGIRSGKINMSEMMQAYNMAMRYAKANPTLMDPERVNRALGLLMKKEVNEHRSSKNACDCKDWENRDNPRRTVKVNGEKVQYSGPCKHMIAEMILIKVNKLRKEHEVTELVKPTVKRNEEELLRMMGY